MKFTTRKITSAPLTLEEQHASAAAQADAALSVFKEAATDLEVAAANQADIAAIAVAESDRLLDIAEAAQRAADAAVSQARRIREFAA